VSEKGLVYIVDDDDAVRDSLDLLLTAAGYRTRTFESADAFLAAPQKPLAAACFQIFVCPA
jgi:FixJ family two-component response regulator